MSKKKPRKDPKPGTAAWWCPAYAAKEAAAKEEDAKEAAAKEAAAKEASAAAEEPTNSTGEDASPTPVEQPNADEPHLSGVIE